MKGSSKAALAGTSKSGAAAGSSSSFSGASASATLGVKNTSGKGDSSKSGKPRAHKAKSFGASDAAHTSSSKAKLVGGNSSVAARQEVLGKSLDADARGPHALGSDGKTKTASKPTTASIAARTPASEESSLGASSGGRNTAPSAEAKTTSTGKEPAGEASSSNSPKKVFDFQKNMSPQEWLEDLEASNEIDGAEALRSFSVTVQKVSYESDVADYLREEEGDKTRFEDLDRIKSARDLQREQQPTRPMLYWLIKAGSCDHGTREKVVQELEKLKAHKIGLEKEAREPVQECYTYKPARPFVHRYKYTDGTEDTPPEPEEVQTDEVRIN
eukprot:g10600.t1